MTTTEQAYFGYEKRLEEQTMEVTLNIYLDGKLGTCRCTLMKPPMKSNA